MSDLPVWKVLGEVSDERAHQDATWGEQNHMPAPWLAILTEEVGEVAQEVNRLTFPPVNEALVLQQVKARKAQARLRAELIQVAAVAVAWVEALDRRSA